MKARQAAWLFAGFSNAASSNDREISVVTTDGVTIAGKAHYDTDIRVLEVTQADQNDPRFATVHQIPLSAILRFNYIDVNLDFAPN